MTAATVQAHRATLSPTGPALAWLTYRQVWRGAALVAVTVTGLCAVVAVQYQTTFADALDSGALRALAENPAIRVLFGEPRALDDAGGFTVWRTGTPVLVLCGVWGLLTATRLTRGEEESGRWDLVLGARVRMVDLVAWCTTVLTLAALVSAVGIGTALVTTGTDPSGAVIHGLCVLGSTATFVSVGVLAAQLLGSRSAATGAACAVLGASLLLRMLADGVSALAWTAWFTPFGLAARAAPYAENRIAPLLALAGLAIAPAVAALIVAQRRDLGGAVYARPDSHAPRTRLLGSFLAFAVRRALAPTAGWAVGIAAYFALIGALTSTIVRFLEQNPRFADLAATAGFGGLGSATGFAAAIFALLAIPTGLYAATRIAAMAADEKARRWTPLHALPLSRYQLAGAEIAVAALGVASLLATAALAMWVGAVSTGAPLGLSDVFAGAFNLVPVVLMALGAATLALGWYPHAVGAIGAVPVVGGFLLDVVAASTDAPAWVHKISPFAHLAGVPDTGPNVLAGVALTALAGAATVLGLLGYAHRDLHG
ncbi:polyketide antibiotic transporter [Nocardia salmonicida]|uniref:polyketide antibiotic transporter n=1 Tax=Nocardia salmonicida TaxID=53431 RepID=UPI00342A3325